MNTEKWIKTNTKDLGSKKIAITGATGGIGYELCRYLAGLNASLILLNRSREKSAQLTEYIKGIYPDADIKELSVDLEDMGSVKSVCDTLEEMEIDVLIHNAGAYSIPRRTLNTGFDNVFQINFLAPYYMTKRLLPTLRKSDSGRVVCVGSIAHNYSKTDPRDIDFSSRKKASLVYGNAKRRLMLSLFKLFEGESSVALAITHPGITFTNITAHYPKLIFAFIKHPMKLIFMKPKKAALCIIKGIFERCCYREWIGPRIFNVWGFPKKHRLNTFSEIEAERVFASAEQIYEKIR